METVMRMRKQGAVDYVTKPFGREMLRQALQRASEPAGCILKLVLAPLTHFGSRSQLRNPHIRFFHAAHARRRLPLLLAWRMRQHPHHEPSRRPPGFVFFVRAPFNRPGRSLAHRRRLRTAAAHRGRGRRRPPWRWRRSRTSHRSSLGACRVAGCDVLPQRPLRPGCRASRRCAVAHTRELFGERLAIEPCSAVPSIVPAMRPSCSARAIGLLPSVVVVSFWFPCGH